jgi:dihydroorotase-like cyclic amidohydrolase
MHSHHREGSESGFEYKDTIYTSTQQCAAGGVTTSVAMPNVTPPPNSLALLKKQFAIYERDAVVDWNFNPAPTIEDEIPRMAETGIAAFKIFMVVDTGRSYPHMPGIGVHDHGKILAIATLLRLQKAAGCHLHILHTQTSGSVDLIRKAKAEGQRVTCEINPWALFLGCEWSAIERLGSYALSYWVPEKNVPSLWQGLNDGTIDIVATDHAPHTREEKEIGWTDGWKAHTGTPSTQFYLSMFLTAAKEGKISMERVVEATSTAPARIFGIEKKGDVLPGHHADLVLVDLEREYEIRDADVLSLTGWSPYAGRKVSGKPVRTIVRGKTVFLDGKVVGEKGWGQQARASYPG